MTSIELRPELADKLNQEAERRQTNAVDLANDWLEEQLWQAWHIQIEAEAERFRAQHPQLLEQYRGQHIAMLDGQVLDHDTDLAALHARAGLTAEVLSAVAVNRLRAAR